MARYALVIGIAQYQSSNLKPLPKAATDAEVVARVLEEYGQYTVTRLPHRWNAESQRFEVAQQKSVSADEVCEALQTLLLEQGTKSDVLIYFAGHGLTFFDNLGEQKGALATSDCQVERVGRQVVNYKHGIDLSSLNRLIKKSDLSSLVMLLDCCHSGYFLESQLVQQTLTAFSTQKDYYLITACRSFETVKALAGEAHAIFTGALLKGLASENASRNGQVSGDRLFDYISNELKGTQWGQEAIRMGWGRCITLVTYPQLETSATEITFDRENPYLGLSAFESEQEKYFCGREEAIRTLITHLTNSRFLSVIGYSGSGKSSLIKAGLLPQLSRDRIPGSSQWPVESFTPGKHPLGKLVDILARHREQNQLFVIFIDQFEEIFTLCEDEAERQGFIRLIAEEMNDSEQKSRMIIALRGDFLIRCGNYPEVLNLINHIPTTTYIVKSLGIEELPEAIKKPAELHGVKFERGLVSHIAQDVAGQPGALPLLQYALKELWRVCIEKPESPEPLLTKKGYEEIGGVQGALENRANVIYQSFSDGYRIFVRKLFMELVQLGEGKEVTRRRVDWDRLRAIADSPEQLEQVIGLLAGAQQRLIIVDENTVEVAHEALLCRWKLLSNWIEEDQENIRIGRRLEVACREWEETYGKSDDALLTGARLAEVEEWEKRVQRNLTGDERDFLGKSVGRRDGEVQAELQQQRQLREAAEAKAMAELEKSIEAEARAKAEAEKAEEARARAKAESQKAKLAVRGGVLLAMLAILTSGLAVWAKAESNRATTNEIKSLTESATTFFSVNYQLESLTASVKALRLIRKQQGEVPTMRYRYVVIALA
ncbi:MAG: caspase family protein, partial [Cyanobacteria bacterium 0813]|nr:caspase family protein [Cyanobacteria bacterium 0813]